MDIPHLHRWDLSPKEAMALQQGLRAEVICRRLFERVSTVAGADIAFRGDRAVAAVIVYRFAEPLAFPLSHSPGVLLRQRKLIEVERAHAFSKLTFPYVPGLLSFREGPALLAAFAKLSAAPDVVLLDGQGIAHPRGIGLASHLGLWLGLPSIGCAKSRLFGSHREPGPDPGDFSPLCKGPPCRTRGPAAAPSGETIGAVLRTRRGIRPVYVSIGHGIDLASAIGIVLSCLDGTRIPKPTREADRLVGALRRSSMDSCREN